MRADGDGLCHQVSQFDVMNIKIRATTLIKGLDFLRQLSIDEPQEE